MDLQGKFFLKISLILNALFLSEGTESTHLRFQTLQKVRFKNNIVLRGNLIRDHLTRLVGHTKGSVLDLF